MIERNFPKIDNINLNNIIKKYLFVNQTKKDLETTMNEIKVEISQM